MYRVLKSTIVIWFEVRDPADYFTDIQDVKITKDMLDLAKHIVEQTSPDQARPG